MAKTKWNYAVVRSIFGDLWIGKTKLLVKKDKIYKDLRDAIDMAVILFEESHTNFNPDDEEDNDPEEQYQYDDLLNTSKDEVEKIDKKIEKYIV